MAITIPFNGAAISKPGAYSALKISPLTGFPLTATGTVGIIGPADGGKPGFAGPFSQASIQQAKIDYLSGPIADAIDLIVNPSNDERIVNGASEIYIYKVNQSTQATLALAPTWGTLTSVFYGKNANTTTFKVEEVAEVKPSFSFTYTAPATDATFGARVNGAAGVTVSILAADTASQAATKITGLTGLTASEASGIITVTVDATTADGVGASLEIYDGGGTNNISTVIPSLHIGAIIGSSAEKQVVYTASHPSKEEEISPAIGGDIVMDIGYQGTTATLTITDTALTTSVVGGAGSNLNITFADYNNLNEIVDYINSQAGYSCSTSYVSATVETADVLDNVSAVGICSTASGLKPGKIKGDSKILSDYINDNSQIVTCAQTAKKGLPSAVALSYLAGGTLGSAANSNWQSGLDEFKLVRINTVVPLIAKDGADEGYGTYDWDSVAAQVKTHVNWGWSTLGKSERNAFIGFSGTKTDMIAKAKTLNSPYVSICGEQHKRVNARGNLVFLPEWSLACLAAGMQNGAEVGEPLTYKYVNSSGRQNDASWNPKLDYDELIKNGILFTENVDSGGFRFVVGNTSYSKDANFTYNRVSVVGAAGYVSYDLRQTLENRFTGIKAATGTATAISNFIKARMTEYLNANIIVADDSAPLGYKNLSVVLDGNTAIINVTIYPVQGIDFTLLTIYLESATQTA